MADTVTDAPAVNATMNETAANATTKIPATPEGMAIAYGSLCLMAVLPIFFGAMRSVKYHTDQRVTCILHFHKITTMWFQNNFKDLYFRI
jgi:hypothetical protein